ncbi:hypothetical protein [Lentzea kentuckyensis]|uniref:hypothetical protein n=1 Tax=Lentzea kentuckyensis TaxID=360086 RepID=UPI001FE24D80|nr:hypothetical protein [Lentzea kentuckyensis]
MGFDVVYLTPIHPIGEVNRKGRNNSLEHGPDDVGSPWAIGSAAGGHDAIHPELGTSTDFKSYVEAAVGGARPDRGAVRCGSTRPDREPDSLGRKDFYRSREMMAAWAGR